MNLKDETLKSWIVLTITIAIFSIIGWSFTSAETIDIRIVEVVELFIAVPVIAIAYYWLVSSKVNEFTKRFHSMEKSFEKLMREFMAEEEDLSDDQQNIEREETTLKQDICELRRLLQSLNRDVAYLRSKAKPKK